MVRARNMIKVQPHHLDVLGDALSYSRRMRVGGDVKDCVYTPTRMYRVEDDYIVVPAGLTTRVCDVLRKSGLAVDYKDLREAVLPEPDLSGLDLKSFRPEQVAMLAACMANDRGVLEAPTGCHAAGAGILLHSGLSKKVEDVKVGQLLMGPDGTPRRVLRLHRGVDEMYTLMPDMSPPFTVNAGHLLVLQRYRDGVRSATLSVKAFLSKGNWWRLHYRLFVLSGKKTRHARFTVKPAGVGEYFGFELDGDHLYLTDDFVVHHNSGKSFLIRQLCKLWPTANIIICSPVTDILRGMRAELLESLPVHQLGFCGDGHRKRARVTLAVDKSLGYCDLHKCQLFLFDEVHRASAPKTAETIAAIHNARIFGFSASPYGRSDNADLETEGMFGPSIHRSTYQQVQESGSVVPIEVHFFSTDRCHNANYEKTVALERNLLWRSHSRNSAVAKAVRWALGQYGDDIQLLVMVSKVEHAVHLGKLLPDFTLVYGNMDAADRVKWEQGGLLPEGVHPLSSRGREQLYMAFHDRTLKRVIATGVWSTGADFPGLNVLVRADAGGGDIVNTQIPGRVSRTADGKTMGVLVDFSDTFNRLLERRAQARRRVYERKGWHVFNHE